MKGWFIKRGYPESVIENEMKKVRFSKQGQKYIKMLRREYHLLLLTTHYLTNCPL